MTVTVTDAEVAQAVRRVAALVQLATERYGVNDEGRAVITAQTVLHALFDDLDPTSFFTDARLRQWESRWRRTRHDGTRAHVKALHAAVGEALRLGLPGDWRMGRRYTPGQVRDVASRITMTKELRTAS